MFGWKTRTGSIAYDLNAKLTELFGIKVADWTIDPDLYFMDEQKREAKGWFCRAELQLLPQAQTINSWPDGAPAVVRHTLGKGHAIRVGTCFFQRYLSSPESTQLKTLESLLGTLESPPLRLANPSAQERMRRLAISDGWLAVILKEGGAREAGVIFSCRGRWQLLGGAWHDVKQETHVDIPLDADGVACLRFLTNE